SESSQQDIEVLVGELEGFAEDGAGERTVVEVNAVAQAKVRLDQVLETTDFAHTTEEWSEDVAERGAGGTGHTAGDVGHAVVYHTVALVNRVGVGGHLAGLEAAT